MKLVKSFLKNKKAGWYVSAAALVLALITIIVYTVRGGNYLSPVSDTAVALLAVTAVIFRYAVGVLADRRTLRYQSELLQKHCEEVQNMYRQTRGWRHD